MRKFVKLDCLVDSNDTGSFPNDVVQSFRRAVLAPVSSKLNIQQALQQINFKYHRTCSFADLIRVLTYFTYIHHKFYLSTYSTVNHAICSTLSY